MAWYKRLHDISNCQVGLLYGIEIEIEGDGIEQASRRMNPSTWVTESDGSLRDGLEFKLRHPKPYDESLSAVADYEEFLKDCEANATPRTSVHIHVNVQDLTNEQFKSFVWLAVALEPVILKFCTQLRNHNGYCLPVYKSVNQVERWQRILSSLDSRHKLMHVIRDMPKYAATGAYRLFDLGTIEFRMFPGCTYAPKIIWYLDILRSIYEAALSNTVQQLQDRKTADGVMSLISSVIVENRNRVTIKEISELIEVGIRMANDCVRTPMSWEDVKSLHNSLFPSKFKPWTSESLLEICNSPDILAEVQKYDPDDLAQVITDEYQLFKVLLANGYPPALAVERSLRLLEVLK